MSETTIVEHPFFDAYAEAFQVAASKELGAEGRQRLKEINCALFPNSYLKKQWPGWEIGIPRPAELVTKEFLDSLQKDVVIFLIDFFKRVEKAMLYCDYSAVVEKFGQERVESRLGKTIGLHFNLEAAYWTFNIKLNKWEDQNIKVYNCSLVCPLDEILARFDSYLREAFFPTPGPYDIGPKKRKNLQKQILRRFAPNLEKPLIKEIYG